MAVITISRQEASGGDEVAAHVAEQLGLRLVTRAYLERAIYDYCLLKTIRQLPLPEIIPPSVDKPGSRVAHRQLLRGVLMNLAARESLVLVGYGGQVIFRRFQGAFHVRVVASIEDRLRRAMAGGAVARAEAEEALRSKDGERRSFLKEFFGAEIGRQHLYDMILNLSRLSPEAGARIVASAFRAAVPDPEESLQEFRRYMQLHRVEEMEAIPDALRAAAAAPRAAFAHPSEEEFARVLDFYRIGWEYEPRSFPIERDEQGRVTESFTPDFYLPEFDTFVELTTMKQDLVTRKNRKIRRLRELYPEVNLKVFYGRDYKELLGKYAMD